MSVRARKGEEERENTRDFFKFFFVIVVAVVTWKLLCDWEGQQLE